MSAAPANSHTVVRTFRGPDPRAALDAVRVALGADAVIIDTRQVGGGLWGRPQIEITAASGAPRAAGGAAGVPEASVQNELVALRRLVEELRSTMPGPAAAAAARQAAAVPSDVSAVYRRLVRRGLDGSTAERLVRQAADDRSAGGPRDLLAAVSAIVRRQLVAAPPPWEPPAPAPGQTPGQRVLALIGPTGVGKTTTIAKIAARALLEARHKVALITIDNYRIGAREHLARYGEIMRLPLQAAGDRSSLATALARVTDADLVLVDTAGRSDAEAITAQGALLRSVPGIELHLVLSAASGSREIRAAARRFAGLGPSRLIFTKLDETDGPASLLSAAVALPRPVSCIADGQRVPDDLHPATPTNLTELVIGPPARS